MDSEMVDYIILGGLILIFLYFIIIWDDIIKHIHGGRNGKNNKDDF